MLFSFNSCFSLLIIISFDKFRSKVSIGYPTTIHPMQIGIYFSRIFFFTWNMINNN
ncbi:hypothetical protein C2G38_2065623 [Gigaspora rosea]|uniref:Uncharacterized protein n=1 Tax=Gigaspora rosea TaxID=44941 RepID=A0A397W455_9GLOM|nr:hypothetical protein C2G38_2065623 [Gigaspora rosea]